MQDFDEIYTKYFSDVYQFVFCLCRDPNLAEEVTQETFFKALKTIDSFHGDCRISTWLCRIAKNTFYSYAKKQNRQAEYPLEAVRSDNNIEELFSDRDAAYRIHQVLHKLQDPYKEVFWLRTFGELPFSQIGSLFGKTESWARVTYYRAKISIREDLK